MNKKAKAELIYSLLSDKPLSNYYNQPISDNDELYYSAKSAILCCKFQDYNRLYIITHDKVDLLLLFKQLSNGKYVVNYPAKRSNIEFDELLMSLGFKHIKTYQRMSTTNISAWSNINEIQYANNNDINDIIYLLNVDSGFVNYLDYLPNENELKELIKRKGVIVNRVDGHVNGVIIYEVFGKRFYLRLWMDKSGNGLKLLFDVHTVMKEAGATYVYWWVDSNNKDVIKIHKFMRGKLDGLNDYIFFNDLNK